MKKIVALLILTTTLFSACDSLKSGAGKISEGKISYKIDLSGSEMGAFEKKLVEMANLNISFKDAMMKMEFGIMGMGQVLIIDGNAKSGLMLVSAMGNKTAARMTAEDLLQKEKTKGAYTVEYSDETKEIAGYKCKKAILKMENGANLTLFYSEDIQPAKLNTDFTYSEIKGFPLEMQMDINGMKFNMVASSVDGTPLTADNFNMAIPEGYIETTMAEFGGMTGAGAN